MDLASSLDSTDTDLIVQAAHAVRYEWNRDLLCSLATVADRLAQRLPGLTFYQSLLPPSAHVQAAIDRIRLAATPHCLCGSYLTDTHYYPEHEAAAGRVHLLEEAADHRDCAYDFLCECPVCHARFQVHYRDYHYPWWLWQRAELCPQV